MNQSDLSDILLDSYEFEWKSEFFYEEGIYAITATVVDYLNKNAHQMADVSVQYVRQSQPDVWTAFITYRQLKKKDDDNDKIITYGKKDK